MDQIAEAKKVAGQLILSGFKGFEPSTDTLRFFKEADIGGVIYFGHNYESSAQIAEASNRFQSNRNGLPLWIAVDHEGGKVQRFKKPFTKIPDAATLSQAESPKLLFEVSSMIARELRAVGVNLNFAPVADINTNPKNPVIGPRAFGSTEEDVSKAVTAFVRGHLVEKVQPCVKHFPGHGDTSVDSHFHLPRVDTDVETLRAREFKTFSKAFKARCSAVMTAHVIVSALDKDRPATLSSKILHDLLRVEMRFKKIIFSDDMEMKAITDHWGAEQAPVYAIEAGCDQLLYRSEEMATQAYQSLLNALDKRALSPLRVLESAKRVRLQKESVLLPFNFTDISEIPKYVGLDTSQKLIDEICGTLKTPLFPGSLV